MNVDETMLRRFRAESPGMISDDLRQWVLAVLTSHSATSRRDARNSLLREAAALAGGTTWLQAKRLHAEMLRRGPALDEIGRLVDEAMSFLPRKKQMTIRSLLTILKRFH